MPEIEYIEQDEKKIAEIRAEALRRAKLINPKVLFAIDSRTIDDYIEKKWDYPGAWYSQGFRLPKGFKNEEELIEDIADHTVKYFQKK